MTNDPLIAAMFGKLPASGQPFPPEQRAAWLKMMALTFDISFGAADDLPPFLPGRAASSDTAPARAPKPLGPVGPSFFIDEQGYARRNGGERILPSDVADVLYDKRGDNGDLGAIVWADDASGVRGLQLDIANWPT